jgi:hypothetical protein
MPWKLFFISAALAVVISSCAGGENDTVEVAEPELLASHYGDGEPMWVGTVERSHLKQSPFDKWYDSGYANYTPSPDTVAELSTSLEAVEVEVYFGTWCSDSTRDVPRLNRVLDDAGFSLDRLEMITLSDRRGEFKLSPDGKERQRLIHRTPTIVISRNGREIGRIVQNPIDSIEEDLLAIASGEPYVPRFGAEARLHEIVNSGGLGALEGRTSELADELGALGDSDSLWHYAKFDLLFNDKPGQAEAALDVFLQLYPESARGHLLLAEAHRALGELDEALIDVRRSLEYDATNEEAKSLEEELSKETDS